MQIIDLKNYQISQTHLTHKIKFFNTFSIFSSLYNAPVNAVMVACIAPTIRY